MKADKRDQLKLQLTHNLRAHFGVTPKNASDEQVFGACAILIREQMSERLADQSAVRTAKRRVHYLSMEFLIGRSLAKNAFNLGILDELYAAISELGKDAADIFETEQDAGLGNGGLGRLAACYMDSMATLELPATGYTICYELGIFRQKIDAAGQSELPDIWLNEGKYWIVSNREEAVEVRFGGHVEQHWDYIGNCVAEHTGYESVYALPRDMLVSGYGTDRVNKLRLWEARPNSFVDMQLFSSGQYEQSLKTRNMAEVITKILYPNDSHNEGKALRIKQQYFLVSATAQTIVRDHIKEYGDILSFAEHNVIQINDTHPALIIPELMRIFIDEHSIGWSKSWKIVSACVAYTNHTVMSEALEAWPQGLIQQLLPRIWELLCEINSRRREALLAVFPDDIARVGKNLIIRDGKVHMAQLALSASFKVNGVSRLHGDILRSDVFRDEEAISGGRIISITNGIDHRRWLTQINPELHALICDLIGDGYLTDSARLIDLRRYLGDDSVLRRLEEIKRRNKLSYAAWLYKSQENVIDADSIFDVQVKRLHEYKRQFMCAMLITHLQNNLRQNPNADFTPRTFIFGAKAASSYTVAKRIISYIVALSDSIKNDPACKNKLSVVFMENYRVSAAERLMPAAQVSEQISTAGKEASGTGNMKLMMNGAITIGTLDGANVEMYERLGDEGLFLFGLKADEVVSLRKNGYDPEKLYNSSPLLKSVLTRINQGFSGKNSFSDLVSRLIYSGDEYMLLADFEAYLEAHNKLYSTISDEHARSRISLLNIAESGYFSADRAVAEYVDNIWS